MNRWIIFGLVCVRIFSHAVKIMNSPNTKVFTIQYDGNSISISKQTYNEFIDCLCRSNSSTTLTFNSLDQMKQIDATVTVKCEITTNNTTKKLSVNCYLIYARTAKTSQNSDYTILCNTNEVSLDITKGTLFTIKCNTKCLSINWLSDGPLNVTVHDPDTVYIHKEPCISSQPELIATSPLSVDKVNVNYSVDTINVNFSDIGSSSNVSTQINVSAHILKKTSNFTSTIVYVISAIFIGCMISFILGVKRISLHSLCLTHMCWVYNKILNIDKDYIRRDKYHQDDSSPPTSETLDQMINTHNAIWHREIGVLEWTTSVSYGDAFEQQTAVSNILVDRIYAEPEISLNLVNALSTEISENQNRICNQTPEQTTSQLQEILRGEGCKQDLTYYEVQVQPDENGIIFEDTYLKTPAEGDFTMTTNAEKVYETPSPIVDQIYFTLRRKSKFLKHNYERIPTELESYHANLGQNESSRLSTFYEIEFAEDESKRKRIQSNGGGVRDDSRKFIFDEEIPIYSVYSSLRQKRRYKHNYEKITSVLDTPGTDKEGETLPEDHDRIYEVKDVHPTITSVDKEQNDIKLMIKNDKETNIYSVFKDFSKTSKPNVMNYYGIDVLDTSFQPHIELDFYLQQGGDVY